jgi:hypothetical protein
MNIVEIAENDLSFVLEDKDSGFGIVAKLIDPDGVRYGDDDSIIGQTTDIGFFIDPDTGIGVRGRNAEIVFRYSTIISKTGVIPTKAWRFEFNDTNGNPWLYVANLIDTDRKLGVIRINLGLLKNEC